MKRRAPALVNRYLSCIRREGAWWPIEKSTFILHKNATTWDSAQAVSASASASTPAAAVHGASVTDVPILLSACTRTRRLPKWIPLVFPPNGARPAVGTIGASRRHEAGVPAVVDEVRQKVITRTSVGRRDMVRGTAAGQTSFWIWLPGSGPWAQMSGMRQPRWCQVNNETVDFEGSMDRPWQTATISFREKSRLRNEHSAGKERPSEYQTPR